MTEVSSHKYGHVYKALGIEIGKLGCVMLDVEPFDVTEHVEGGEGDLYSSENPERSWVQGAVAEDSAHVTLLYGLLAPGPRIKGEIDEVLSGWTPPQLQIEDVAAFPSPYEDEDYVAIIGHIKVSDELLEGHHRLQLLPHIDTFPAYKPHLTLAYVKTEAKQKWIDALSSAFSGDSFTVTRLNYGKDRT